VLIVNKEDRLSFCRFNYESYDPLAPNIIRVSYVNSVAYLQFLWQSSSESDLLLLFCLFLLLLFGILIRTLVLQLRNHRIDGEAAAQWLISNILSPVLSLLSLTNKAILQMRCRLTYSLENKILLQTDIAVGVATLSCHTFTQKIIAQRATHKVSIFRLSFSLNTFVCFTVHFS